MLKTRPSSRRAMLTLPASKSAAYLAAGNRNPAHHHYRIDAHVKAKLLAQFLQACGIALGIVAKVKIIAFMHFFCMQFAGKNIAGKFFRRGHGKIAGKGNFQQRVQSGLRQQRFFLCQRRNQSRRHVRTQNAEWMRLKRYRHRLAVALAGALRYFFQHAQVPAMDPIKISYADESSGQNLRALPPANGIFSCDLELQLQPVMRQAHVFRQVLVRFAVRQIVGDMRKESALRL